MTEVGWTALEAFNHHQGPGLWGFGDRHPNEIEFMDPREIQPFYEWLTDGVWHATGRRVTDKGIGPSNPEIIPPDWWEFLILDFHVSSASGGGVEFVGVRIFDGPLPAPVESAAPVRSSGKARADCGKWLVEELKHPRTQANTKEKLKDVALQQFSGLSVRSFAAAWKDAKDAATTNPDWHKRGPAPSS